MVTKIFGFVLIVLAVVCICCIIAASEADEKIKKYEAEKYNAYAEATKYDN